MTIRMIVRWGMISAFLFLASCQNPEEPSEGQAGTTLTKVTGTVLRSDNLAPVANVLVYDLGGLARDTSKTDGSFLLKFQLASRYNTKIVTIPPKGFTGDTVSTVFNPGVDTTITVRVKADSSSPIGGVSSGKAANIVLVGSSGDNVSIRGTGANETVVLTFEARDSLGIAVGGTNKIRVNFSILGGPGGGEYVFPVAADTDPLTGRVTTRVSSGTKAGVLQVYASATVSAGVMIKSSPVRLTISGGLPVLERFSLGREKANIAGGVYNNLRTKISVLVGDKEGNPVQTGTAVSFTTTGGIIQPSATTDKDGSATVELISGNPRPANGVAVVTAKTIGDSGTVISRSTAVIFSGATRIIAPSTTFEVPDSGEYNFAYKVQDANGNPLVGGTTIVVSVSGTGASNLVVEGDANVTLPDTDDPSYTNFSARIRDTKTGGASGPATVTITVTSQNGNSVYSFNGTVKPAAAVVVIPPSARQPSQIAFISITKQDIFVAGVGADENSVITYEVRDSLGVPIDKLRRVYARFSIQFFPNVYVGGGSPPTVIPGADSTDDAGRLRASIISGTQSGVVQLVARISLPNGTTITSLPVKVTVHAGFPDQNHFTLIPSRYVFPGIDGLNIIPFTVVVGDTFSNPVQAGTAVYFNSQAGVMQTGTTSASYTASDGVARANLYTVNPKPITSQFRYNPTAGMPFFAEIGGRVGYHWVYAQTQGKGTAYVVDSALVVWTRAPITVTGLPTTTVSVPRGGGAGSTPISVTIKDGNGNPLPDGTTVVMSITFTSDVSGIQFGVSGGLSSTQSFTMPNAAFARFPGQQVTDFTFRVFDLSTNGGATLGQTLVVTMTVNAPGIGTFVQSFNCTVN